MDIFSHVSLNPPNRLLCHVKFWFLIYFYHDAFNFYWAIFLIFWSSYRFARSKVARRNTCSLNVYWLTKIIKSLIEIPSLKVRWRVKIKGIFDRSFKCQLYKVLSVFDNGVRLEKKRNLKYTSSLLKVVTRDEEFKYIHCFNFSITFKCWKELL